MNAPLGIRRRNLAATPVVLPLTVEAPFGAHRRRGAETSTVGGAARRPTHTYTIRSGALCCAALHIRAGGSTKIHVRLADTTRRAANASVRCNRDTVSEVRCRTEIRTDTEAWERQLRWGKAMQWIAIAYCENAKQAQQLIEKTEVTTGKTVHTVRGGPDTVVTDALMVVKPQHTSVLVIDASAERNKRLAEAIIGMNRGRERIRRLARDGVLIILPVGAHTIVRDLAPDIRSASIMTWWP